MDPPGVREENRKIIFVAHSLGGLVTQDCLWTSRNHPEKHLRQVSACAVGISFLGTPHHGADLAAWAKFGTIIARIVKHANSNIVSVLQPGSEMLARIQDGFHGLLRMRRDEGSEIALTCFFEELPLPVVGKDMTKFNDRDDDGYTKIVGELRRWVKGLQANDSPEAAKPLFLVPFSRDATFVDRVKIFEDIDEKSKTYHGISLSGIGGVGKSQIAIEYCYRFQNLHPTKHIFWVHSSTTQRLKQAYKVIARRLELPGWNDPAADTLLLVSEWFNDNREWFMVLDNADDQDTFFATSTSTVADGEQTRPLSDYLPRDSQGLMLITTRDQRMGERLAGRHASIIVRPLTSPEAEELLRSQLQRHHARNDDDSSTLLNELGYIPLAITQAAAFISQNSLTLTEYLDMFRTDDSEIQDLLNEDLGDPRRDSESLNSVLRTWKLSFDLISKQQLRAAEMLSLMAVLDRQGIPKSLLQNNVDRKIDVIRALGTLQAFSLITLEDNGATYQLHRLVQLATRKWLELQGTKEKWQEQALRVLNKEFPLADFENWTICESLLPHAQTVIQYEDIPERHSAQYSQAIALMRQVVNLRTKIIGANHPNTLNSTRLLKDWSGTSHSDNEYFTDAHSPLAIENSAADSG
ncbi:MAG: hypothetical protein Q9161_008926 [Pseudevernia consocians]